MLKYWGLLFATCGIILTMYGVRANQADYDVHLHAYAAPQTNAVVAVFGTVTKNSDGTDKVTSIGIDGAARTELHTMSMENDIMKMRKVDGYTLAKGDTLTLSHSGDHIMVFDRENDWVDGAAVNATLSFASGETVSTTIEIQSRSDKKGHHAH